MAQREAIVQQALSYVRHQAAKSMDDLAALMERTAVDCDRSVDGVSDRQGAFVYDQEWSIKEVLGHLLLSLSAVNEDLAGVAEGGESHAFYGEGPFGKSPTSGGDRSILELRKALADSWSETIGLARSLSEQAGRKPVPEHPVFGPLNVKEWIVFQRLHALDHVQQIERVRAAGGYPKI